MQVKICGITNVQDALACVEAGADAIGFVFYKNSPRHILISGAVEIYRSLPEKFCTVGVFVNEDLDCILKIAHECNLIAVQLHGRETPEMVSRLRSKGLKVIKAVFANRHPSFEKVSEYNPDAFLVECPGMSLPGGTGKAWNWELAGKLETEKPIILAGGLTPENVMKAIKAARPDAVDVSSGVEIRPGVKDHDKIRNFVKAARSDVSPLRADFIKVF